MPNTGALINLEKPKDEDGPWIATQQELDHEDEQERNKNELPIEWSFGPITNMGKLNTDSYELTVTPSYSGIEVGTITGNSRDTLGVELDLFSLKGQQIWYLKNGNELWTHINARVTFDGHFEGDYKILTF